MSDKKGEWSRIGVNGSVCEGECMRHSLEDESLILRSCHSFMNPLGGNVCVAEPTT